MLKGILSGLRAGGRLVIVERIDDSLRAQGRAEQTAKHQLSEDLTAQELETAGFTIIRKDSTFRPFTGVHGKRHVVVDRRGETDQMTFLPVFSWW